MDFHLFDKKLCANKQFLKQEGLGFIGKRSEQ